MVDKANDLTSKVGDVSMNKSTLVQIRVIAISLLLLNFIIAAVFHFDRSMDILGPIGKLVSHGFLSVACSWFMWTHRTRDGSFK